MGEHPKNFQVPDAIGPLEKITVPFKTEEFITTESVMEFNKSVSISSDNDLFLNLSVKYFIAGAATEIASDKAEIRKFRSKSANGLYAYTLRTDLNLLPIEYGDELIKSGENMGTWYSFNPDGTVRLNEIISKRFFFQIMNKDINPDAFYPEIRKNKEWIKPEFARTDKGYMFFCDDQTDSIRLIAKQLKADFAYHFDESTNSSGGSFYLIAENEEYLLQGQIKIPVKYFDDFYLISWDYAKTTREGNNFNYRNHIEKLIKPFPGVRFNEFPLISEQYIIDFSQVSKNVKLAVLKNLSEDEYIDAVSIQIQLFDQDPTFAQKTISIQYNNNVIPSQNLEILKQNGFGNIQVANGSTHVYHATFQSKLLDRSFYQILNQLSREKEMVIVTPSLMYKTELEFDPGNLPRD
jgi:hypothetical protein